jgi:hypothetical protein
LLTAIGKSILEVTMKARNKGAIAVAFALMAMIARPQIIFAQTLPAPIKGSWDEVIAIPSGEKVTVRLRNKETLNGRMIGASDTVLTVELRKKSRDVARGDVLKVYRVVPKSNIIEVLIGTAVGIGVGAAIGAAIEPEGGDDPGLTPLVFGILGALFGGGAGAVIGGKTKRLLIYETK